MYTVPKTFILSFYIQLRIIWITYFFFFFFQNSIWQKEVVFNHCWSFNIHKTFNMRQLFAIAYILP